MVYPSIPQKKHARRAIPFLILAVWFVLLAILALNRQNLSDWLALRNYQAPSAVASLAADDTMTAYAKKVFYVNHPQLEPKADFKDCDLGKEQAAVLGCYHGGQGGIFVLRIDDPRLNGIEQVTSAHEMLHAAYERLSSGDKQRVDAMLQTYYQHGLHDPTVIDQMNAYKQSEPDALVDEMHSVFGTEIADLPSGLQQYYARYFTDRTKVTDNYAAYQAEFTSRQATIKADDTQLTAWKGQITSLESDIKARRQELQARQSQLDAYRSDGDTADYNAGVPGYNALVAAYNGQIAALQKLIAQYNDLVDARNAVALEAQQLSGEITSNDTPISQ